MRPFFFIFLSLLVFSLTSLRDFSLQAAEPAKIVVIGDSISDGYGVSPDQAYPALLEEMAKKDNLSISIQNAAVSGSLTSSAPSRVRWALKSNPDVIILQLGGNDALKATPAEKIQQNLETALQEAKKSNVPVVLAGMKIFGNFGAAYARSFERVYPELAKKYPVVLVPYILERVGGDPALNLADGIHPNAKGHQEIARTVYPYLKQALNKKR